MIFTRSLCWYSNQSSTDSSASNASQCNACLPLSVSTHASSVPTQTHKHTHSSRRCVCTRLTHHTSKTREAISKLPFWYLFQNVNVCVCAHVLIFIHIFIYTVPTKQMPRAQESTGTGKAGRRVPEERWCTQGKIQLRTQTAFSTYIWQLHLHSTRSPVWRGMESCNPKSLGSAFSLQPTDRHLPFPSQLLT